LHRQRGVDAVRPGRQLRHHSIPRPYQRGDLRRKQLAGLRTLQDRQTNDTHKQLCVGLPAIQAARCSIQNAVQYGVITKRTALGRTSSAIPICEPVHKRSRCGARPKKFSSSPGSDSDPTSQDSAAGSNYAIFGQNSNQGGKSDFFAPRIRTVTRLVR